MKSPEYQETVKLPVDLPSGIRALTAECFVDWLIEYKGLPEYSRENVIDNLKRDYQLVELQGALKQAMAQPKVSIDFSLFGKSK